MTAEIAALERAHALFAGHPGPGPVVTATADAAQGATGAAGEYARAYREASAASRAVLDGARAADAELAAILAAARRDHDEARRNTGTVLAAARSDPGPDLDNPIAAREWLRRRVLRLRAQQSHVRAARRRARRRQAALRALRYRAGRSRDGRGGVPDSRARAAVRAALSRLGCPYVWGAQGPNQFDCSGLVKWAYAQAGVPLERTTYDQINAGIPVARSQVRPGDLVFPHTGHVQMAIGDNLVVEAPTPGARVQISPLGASIAIRRPV